MTQPKRTLGSSGIEIAPLVFGGNVFGWTVDERQSFALLDEFVAHGFNFIDTADVYANWVPGNKGGESETVIGKWLKRTGNRHRVVIATKVGHRMTPKKYGLKKKYILNSVHDSLKRLKIDCIDLYQTHRDDPETSVEETLETYGKLVKEGKVRAIGASNLTAERLLESLAASARHGYPRYASLQPRYNLYDRAEYESTLETVCLEQGLAVIPYFSLASGFLTGKYQSTTDLAGKARARRVEGYLNDRGFRILSALDDVAKQLNVTPGQIAIAWLLARPSITAPIASATTIEQLHELMTATSLKLDYTHLAILNEASAVAVSETR